MPPRRSVCVSGRCTHGERPIQSNPSQSTDPLSHPIPILFPFHPIPILFPILSSSQTSLTVVEDRVQDAGAREDAAEDGADRCQKVVVVARALAHDDLFVLFVSFVRAEEVTHALRPTNTHNSTTQLHTLESHTRTPRSHMPSAHTRPQIAPGSARGRT